MHANVKKYADSNDLTSLRYVFYDCLDVDPSFDKYIEDYEYACKVSGFLDEYVDLTPFSSDESEWDEDYWLGLKKDLKKNFSDKRFNHMKDVARVVHADKLKRIEDERAKKNSSEERKESSLQMAESQPQQVESKSLQVEPKSQQIESQSQKIDTFPQQKTVSNKTNVDKSLSSAQRTVQKIDNSAFERQREKEAQERIKKEREIEEANRKAAEEKDREETIKKDLGIVAILVVVVTLLILIFR